MPPTASPDRPLGFPVRTGRTITDVEIGDLIGLPALVPGTESTPLTQRHDQPCPFCHGELFIVPTGVIVGRIVGKMQGRIAVDPLPPGARAVGCMDCRMTFYTHETHDETHSDHD